MYVFMNDTLQSVLYYMIDSVGLCVCNCDYTVYHWG